MSQNGFDLDIDLGKISACTCVSSARCRTCAQIKRHGLSRERLLRMFTEQNQRCRLCGIIITLSTLVVDHDHGCCPTPPGCGKCVRGLLCQPCNQGLGMLGDDLEGVTKAQRYLEDWEKRKPATVKVREAYGFPDLASDFKAGLVSA